MAKVDLITDWTSSVNSILRDSASSSSFSSNDLQNLAKLISKSESEILNHSDDLETFYSSFIALATHYICSNVGCLSKGSLADVNSACRVMMLFLLERLQHQRETCTGTISKKHMMVLMRSLCKGSSSLPKSDIVTFNVLLKSSKAPEGCIIDGSDVAEPVIDTQQKRPSKETSVNLYKQLTSVLDEIPSAAAVSHAKSKVKAAAELVSGDGDTCSIHGNDPAQELRDLFVSKNIVTLQQLNGSDVLLEVCTALAYLKRYKLSFEDAVKGKEYSMPSGMTEALSIRMSLQSIMNDILIVWRIFSLPVLEPMTRIRLQKIVGITMSCLQASVAATLSTSIVAMATGTQMKGASTTRDDEIDGYAAVIVQKTLDIFNWVSTAIQKSSKAGGHVLQNFHLLGTWCLLKGLQCLLNLSPAVIFEKPKDSAAKTKQTESASKQRDSASTTLRPGSAMKLHTGFGPLCVALSVEAIKLLTLLMTDLEMESLSTYKEADGGETEAELTLFGEYMAINRVRKLMRTINFPNLMVFLVGQSFKKAMSFGKQNPSKSEGATIEINSDGNSSSSDSNTFYEEDFSSSENSSNEDDDSEPILGQWFEETLSPTDSKTTESSVTTNAQECEESNDSKNGSAKNVRHQNNSDSGTSYLPDKKEPDGFINLASEILQFIGEHLLRSPNVEVRKCFSSSSLTDQHMANLAALIKDLDKELPTLQSGSVYETFSTAMAQFIHLLISGETLSEALQDSLLHHLGVSLNTTDGWPLRIRPRTLAVLAEVILLRQQNEKDSQATKKNSETVIMNIWSQFIATLVGIVENFDNNLADFDDINVEHLQLLVFLFHGLTLMQKKSLWLQLCQCILKLVNNYGKQSALSLAEVIPLPMSRMLLVVDYLLHFFYDMPPALIDQLQYNLFGAFARKVEDASDKDLSTKRYFVCREVEENYTKYSSTKNSSELTLKPMFYNIGPTDYTYQDTPKVDGLACSFLLSNPELLSYDTFYDAVIILLSAGSRLDKTLKDDLTLLEACSMQYHFVICWRLLGCLPPSLKFLHDLESGKPPVKDSVLHTLRWVPRLAHKTFQVWTKDYLLKQGLTVQKAECLLWTVNKNTNSLQFDIDLAHSHIMEQLSVVKQLDRRDVLTSSNLPFLSDLYMLDSILAKIQVSLDDHFTKSSSDSELLKNLENGQMLIPHVLTLITTYCIYIRSCLFNQVIPSDESQCSVAPAALQAYNSVVSIGSSHNTKLGSFATNIMLLLPAPVKSVFEKWNSSSPNEFPAILSWRNAFANDVIPVESYIESIQTAHLNSLSGQQSFVLNSSLKHILYVLVKFCVDLTNWYPDSINVENVTSVFFPLYCDATTENLTDSVVPLLEKLIGSVDSEEFCSHTLSYTVDVCHSIITGCSNPENGLDERIAHECLSFLEANLDKAAGKVVMEKFYANNDELLRILLSAANSHLSPMYGTKVLKFFNRLVQLADKHSNDKSYEGMCSSLRKLATLEMTELQNWLSKMIMIPPAQLLYLCTSSFLHGEVDQRMRNVDMEEDAENIMDGEKTNEEGSDDKVHENRLLLQSLTSYIVKDNSHIGEEVAMTILGALIPMGSQILSPTKEGFGFPDLMVVMVMLAGAGAGSGHASLFKAAICWLELCKTYLAQKNVVEKIKENVTNGKHQMMLDSACCLLSYVKDILTGLKHASSRQRAASPVLDHDLHNAEADSDCIEDLAPDDEESVADDSDEDSLSNKLCTYTITQKEFMNQHWYHCHTCKMVDGVGVCTVCAKVCHKDHDLSYAKYGSFFCDCGAKEDNVCQALTKRSSAVGNEGSSSQLYGSFPPDPAEGNALHQQTLCPGSDDRSKETSGWKEADLAAKINDALLRQIENSKDALISSLNESTIMTMLIDLLQFLMPSIVENYQELSPLGSRTKALQAMKELRELPKTIETSDVLMTATLGSQEGAFENVRINYSGDQGQTIRQLITSHVLRRIGMCCLTSPHGRRQHLAVCNEKGKVTILQLSALLKQAHSSKRKLTLTRLSSAPIPFTVLSIAGSPCNEDFLAVCGLKDCHVLTFTSSGTVSDHLVLQPALETGNFIIKAVWLPGSQTELAIVTADFVKIYNLAVDAISPQYYFLLPTGKIRDITFVTAEDGRYLLIMGSSGYIYTQIMDETSSARHGTFYITNILDVKHSDVKETSGQVAGGGVSIYFSHALQLLFFSYSQGKSFAAPLSKSVEELSVIFPINLKSSNGGKSSASAQPLVQWTELHNHPGLVCCMTQTSNSPVVLMIKPDVILVQEIKVLPAKAKVQDMVLIRHMGSNTDKRTTLILLCEDGSLRIYMANVEQTNFWMLPTSQPPSSVSLLKPAKKKRATQVGRPLGQVNFPVDFFESCQLSNDVEFGGNDVLQVYNTAQLKLRLNTTGMYVASTKPGGFSVEVTNSSTGTVMVGVRVLVGSQSLERAPSYIEIFDRITQVNLSRHRWYDLPFTREESLTADKKFTINFGPSNDSAGVTMVDSIKVYTKTKEAAGWPEDSDESPDSSLPKSPSVPNVAGYSSASDVESSVTSPLPLTPMDKLIVNALEVLDGCFVASTNLGDKDPVKPTALEISTKLLTLPVPAAVQQQTKALMSGLFASRASYHWHKDQAQLQQVLRCLTDFHEKKELDGEVFQHLVFVVRSVAISRPLNLVQFADNHLGTFMKLIASDAESHANESQPDCMKLDPSERAHLVAQLSEAFWFLESSQADNLLTSPVCSPGVSHIEALVAAVVDIFHAFTHSSRDILPLLCKLYTRMLLSEDQQISFACKQAMVRVTRPLQRSRHVFITSPPRCSTPDAKERSISTVRQSSDLPQIPAASVSDGDEPHFLEPGESSVEPLEANNDPSPHAAAAAANALDVLLAGGGGGNLQSLLDIPPDADDETMVQLAIALSLQDQPGASAGAGSSDRFQGLQAQLQAGSLEAGLVQDTSAPVSDDEVASTAATEGSAMFPLPADQRAGSGAGSESGGSNVDSVSVSGRSSAYEDVPGEMIVNDTHLDLSEQQRLSLPRDFSGLEHSETDIESSNHQLHSLRIRILEQLISYLPQLRTINGVRAIPFMQLVLSLTYELNSEGHKDKAILDLLLSTLLSELHINRSDVSDMATRTEAHEVQLVILRLLSVLMSRTKVAGTKGSSEVSTFVSNSTGAMLLQSGGLDYCFLILKTLLDVSKKTHFQETEGASLPGHLLRPRPVGIPPDMSPFFLRQYVKSHANDVFEDYPQLLIEIALRLPYQVRKIAESLATMDTPAFDASWYRVLAEYMMTQQVPFVKRQVRKLLLYACGSKDKYRQLRDMHFLEKHMSGVRTICEQRGLDVSKQDSSLIILTYDMLINVIEHLKSCLDVATTRTINWQKYCQKDETMLPFLILASISLDDGVAPLILQLLQYVLCGIKSGSEHSSGKATASATTSSPAKQKKERKDEKSDSTDGSKKREDSEEPNRYDEAMCIALVQQVCKTVSRELLIRFIVCFLLESNSTSVRWQAHALVLHIYRSSPLSQREALLDLMWNVWPDLPNYGCKAAQFVDLLGYFTIKTPQPSDKKMKQYVEKALALMRVENKKLANHPSGSIYNILQGLVDFDGYYLERDPCLVCNNPEVPFANVKLSSIKVDSRFTTTTQIVKLAGSQTISKIFVKIGDIKRTKMVRTLIVYYNNRQVQAVVELKNKLGLWHKAKKVVLSAGQTEVKIEFLLPIVACNLMIEYADFYDNLQASAETLQCPRCSASVPANPGVCGNCGENVFQCHKCRAINYDEKDPFLCNACGFCKYAKFDFTLTTKPCCAVDPIENDEDRKKAVTTINTLLERADHQYKQLQLYKSSLEALLVKVSEHTVEKVDDPSSTSTSTAASTSTSAASSAINKTIQQLAQKYCGDCRTAFEDLGKIIQKVLASRKELIEYDRQQQDAAQIASMPGSTLSTPVISPKASELFASVKEHDLRLSKPKERRTHCYGCASATVEHCITLLRAMATNPVLKNFLCGQGLIRELVDYNLRRGPPSLRAEVRHLLCLMSNSNPAATEELSELLTKNITLAIQGHLSNPDFASAVRHEMFLLSNLLQLEDHLWEQRIRCVMRLFMQSMHIESPAVIECISLPCLRILQHIIRPAAATSKKNKDKPLEALCTVRPSSELHVNLHAWLSGEATASFQSWRQSMPSSKASDGAQRKKKDEKPREKELEKRVVRVRYLVEKYGAKWRNKVVQSLNRGMPLKLMDRTWLRKSMFSASSAAIRQTECNIIEALCVVPSRKQDILDMLSSCLDEVGYSGEASSEFLSLYKRLIANGHWKYYLSLKGVLGKIASLINKEIEELCCLEETSLGSDLSQGYALKALTDLLATFLEVDNIKQHYKSRLVGSVLNGYLSLRKLVIQRSKMIDDTQDKLLELLEEMTTGTESETKEFMSVCVETVNKYPSNDFISPVFIFERLCSIIYPEANDVAEFFMSLEKEPQQEDFLQGRMLGNPYSSTEPGLGPLMRDVKNKICQDCELVALLEDDTGMELLVCNKIISLDLAVKDVHRKIWLPEHSEGEPMRIVYRMRGLLGDATEDMINTLETGKDEDIDSEVVYKMANVMSQCSGLKVMLQRLAAVRNLVTGKQLTTVLLKLFCYCLKVKANRQELVKLEMNSVSIMLGALNLALLAEQESGTSTKGLTLTEQMLQIMETILLEASSQPPEMYKEFSKLCGDKDQLMVLLDRINSPFVRANGNVLQALMRLIPFLAFGDQEKMLALVNHFRPYLDFNRYDFDHTQDEQIHLDCFCVIAQGIEKNANGKKLKDLISEHSMVKDTLEYIQMHAPVMNSYQQGSDSESWKEFISKPSLPYVLRMLTGLCRGHDSTQVLIGETILPILHNLEQISSDEHIGSLAENLLEALKENAHVAEKIEEVRQQTKAEKKRQAMAMREKQLDQLGMMTNEKGQVTVKGLALKHMEDLKDETGLVCCICREGYRYQPVKVLGIYTFTKRVNVDDFEAKPRKTQGYSTVSHFNIVHVDCHLAAVRHARGREEWDSAALQNGNTKCNGLLPLWGPEVPESAYASCLARHNTYLQDCTGVRDATYSYTIHDLKHLMLKFAFEKSFSEDSGGGGRESNVQLLPYIMHMALYVINTTRSVVREEKNLTNFLKLSSDKWVENSYEVEGPFYWTVMAVHVFDHANWKQHRLSFLKRLIVLGHARSLSPDGVASLSDKTVKDYSAYKPYLMFFALADALPNIFFKKCGVGNEGNWAASLANYIRNNDQGLQEQAKRVLSNFEEELIPCESLAEFLDAAGLLEDVLEPDRLILDVLSSLP